MSDLVKVQNTPQFNWYTQWTSLGANGMPDKLIKEGLKQPDQIKVSFKKETKEITGHDAPDQARFGTEYFLAYTLPNFKSKILIDYRICRRTMVHCCLASWVSAFST
jgi:hypothetical protein